MSYPKWLQSFLTIRLFAYVLPPVGVILLWLTPLLSLKKKVLGTIHILVYAIGVGFGLLVMGALLWAWQVPYMEWRGSYWPTLTLSKTVPDYGRLEADRAQQSKRSFVSELSSTNSAPYWTGFRGPKRDGHYTQQPILTNWPATGLRELWRQPSGGGYASFSIAEGRAYTIEQRREQEVVVAYDENTGRELWDHGWESHFIEGIGGDGPRATPTYDAGRIYALGGTGELRCLDAANGKLLWRCDVVAENGGEVLTYGISASPLVVDGKVILLPGGDQRSVVALDKNTGKAIWRSHYDKQAYTSPMLVELAGKRQLLVVSAFHVLGFDPNEGKLLWEFPWRVQNDNVIAQPVIVGPNRFFLSAGYGKGCVVLEVKEQGKGLSADEVWHNNFLKNKFTSSVFWNGYVYGLDEEILTCLDATTGKRQWKEGRYGYGQLLLASGHLIILSGSGDLALLKASPDHYEEISRFPAIKGKTWNHPAIADGKIFVRNSAEMACFDITGK